MYAGAMRRGGRAGGGRLLSPAHGPVGVGPSVACELEAAVLLEAGVPPPLRRAAERGAAVPVWRGAVLPARGACPVLAVRAASSHGDAPRVLFLLLLRSCGLGWGLCCGRRGVAGHSGGGAAASAVLVATAHRALGDGVAEAGVGGVGAAAGLGAILWAVWTRVWARASGHAHAHAPQRRTRKDTGESAG